MSKATSAGAAPTFGGKKNTIPFDPTTRKRAVPVEREVWDNATAQLREVKVPENTPAAHMNSGVLTSVISAQAMSQFENKMYAAKQQYSYAANPRKYMEAAGKNFDELSFWIRSLIGQFERKAASVGFGLSTQQKLMEEWVSVLSHFMDRINEFQQLITLPTAGFVAKPVLTG